MVEIFTEVIIAPDASEEAIAIIGAKRHLRLLLAGRAARSAGRPGLAAKTVAGGLLVQSRDTMVVDDMVLKDVTRRQPGEHELADLASPSASPSTSSPTPSSMRGTAPPWASGPAR